MKKSCRDDLLVRHFLRAYGLVAIYVAVAAKNGRTLVGRSHAIAATRTALAAEHGSITLRAVWWVADDAKADHILSRLTHDIPAAQAIDDIPRAASIAGILLTGDADVRARALAHVEAMRLANAAALRRLNAAYREERLDRERRGRRMRPYNAWIAHQEVRLMYAYADDHRQQTRRRA